MTGLDKIIERIEAGAKLKADDIISEAKAEAARIIESASERTDSEASALIEKTRAEAQLIERIAASGSELDGKKLLLSVRQETVASVIAEALKRLSALSDDDYFAVCEKIALRCADKGEGEIVFSKKDSARMPKDFIARLNSKLSAKGASLSASGDSVETGGGFVLRYGGVEENCAFSAIVEQDRDQLADSLGKILFG